MIGPVSIFGGCMTYFLPNRRAKKPGFLGGSGLGLLGLVCSAAEPGVSSTTSKAIFQKFQNISNLIKELHDNPACLNEVCTVDSNGKSRKIRYINKKSRKIRK